MYVLRFICKCMCVYSVRKYYNCFSINYLIKVIQFQNERAPLQMHFIPTLFTCLLFVFNENVFFFFFGYFKYQRFVSVNGVKAIFNVIDCFANCSSIELYLGVFEYFFLLQMLLAQLTKQPEYMRSIRNFCDYNVYSQKKTPKGLLFIDKFGTLCHASNIVFLCLQVCLLKNVVFFFNLSVCCFSALFSGG